MTFDEVVWHAELTAYGADFVFEEQTEGFAQTEVHLFGQTAYVVVALDGCAGDGEAFDAVGVDGSLSEPFDVFDLMGFFIKHIDEAFAYDLALAFGFGDSGEFAEEFFRGVDADHVEAETFVVVEHVAEFVFAQHAVVYEDAGEVLADGAVEEHCGYRGVDSATEAEHHLVIAELLFELGHCRFDE